MSRNPKDVAAQTERRVRLDLLEPVAEAQIARAMEFGAIDKGYGIRNFVAPGNDISLRCYLAAMRRHIDALLDGEDEAPDSGLHHLAHVGANVHVVLAAKAAGTLVDDRSPHLAALRDEMERRDAIQAIEEAAQPGIPPLVVNILNPPTEDARIVAKRLARAFEGV